MCASFAASPRDVELLVDGYHRDRTILGILLHLGKAESWCFSLPGRRSVSLTLSSGALQLETRATFRMVGTGLGSNEIITTTTNIKSRLLPAILSGRRLAGLAPDRTRCSTDVAFSCSSQGLFGCEVRIITDAQVVSLCALGKTTVPRLPPLCLNRLAVVEAYGIFPVGSYALRDPRLEMLSRRIRWLQTVANHAGLVGNLHSYLASGSGIGCVEPNTVLTGSLSTIKWTMCRNMHAVGASRWPVLDAERSYRITHVPRDLEAPAGSVWTDGSVCSSGGVAALQRHSHVSFRDMVSHPSRATHCELVALTLVQQFRPSRPLILADSFCYLQLIGSWGHRPASAVFLSSTRACT